MFLLEAKYYLMENKEWTYVNISDYQNTRYQELLKIIFDLCSTFKIIDMYGDLSVDSLEIHQNLINVKRSNSWEGTKIKGRKAYIYFFEITKDTKKFFDKYDSFFYTGIDGITINTAFGGQYDYSFIEKETDKCLLYITTHEKGVYLRKDIYNEYFLK